MFLFLNKSSCQIYNLDSLKEKQTIKKPIYQVHLKNIEPEVYVTNNSKQFVFIESQVTRLHHLYRINLKNKLEKVELNYSKLTERGPYPVLTETDDSIIFEFNKFFYILQTL